MNWFLVLGVFFSFKIISFFLLRYNLKNAEKFNNKEITFPLPIFSIPKKDLEKGNNIDCIFIKKTDKKTSFSVILKDEDWPKIDSFHDPIRKFFLGRIEDIESFVYKYKSNQLKNNPDSIKFIYIYSGKKTFKKIGHGLETIAFDKFESKDSRPVIYINTWNHSFSESDNNPELEKTYIYDYSMYFGNRLDAERFVRYREKINKKNN